MSERRKWLRRMWSHWRRARSNDRYTRTSFWNCVKATIAVLLDRYVDDTETRWDTEVEELAWGDDGVYMTDYGEGRSWNTLVLCRGLRYAIFRDGSL